MIEIEDRTELEILRDILAAIEDGYTEDAADAIREMIEAEEYALRHPQPSRGAWFPLSADLRGKGLKVGWYYNVLTASKWVTVAKYMGSRQFALSNGAIVQNATHFSFLPYFSTAK